LAVHVLGKPLVAGKFPFFSGSVVLQQDPIDVPIGTESSIVVSQSDLANVSELDGIDGERVCLSLVKVVATVQVLDASIELFSDDGDEDVGFGSSTLDISSLDGDCV